MLFIHPLMNIWIICLWSPEKENGYRLQYSCLGNPMDRRAWWNTMHGVIKSQTCLNSFLLFKRLMWIRPLWIFMQNSLCRQMSLFLLNKCLLVKLFSVQFSCSVVSDSLWPHESQHTRPPCPSPTPGVHSDSSPSSPWCHLAISSSVVPFSSCP